MNSNKKHRNYYTSRNLIERETKCKYDDPENYTTLTEKEREQYKEWKIKIDESKPLQKKEYCFIHKSCIGGKFTTASTIILKEEKEQFMINTSSKIGGFEYFIYDSTKNEYTAERVFVTHTFKYSQTEKQSYDPMLHNKTDFYWTMLGGRRGGRLVHSIIGPKDKSNVKLTILRNFSLFIKDYIMLRNLWVGVYILYNYTQNNINTNNKTENNYCEWLPFPDERYAFFCAIKNFFLSDMCHGIISLMLEGEYAKKH